MMGWLSPKGEYYRVPRGETHATYFSRYFDKTPIQGWCRIASYSYSAGFLFAFLYNDTLADYSHRQWRALEEAVERLRPNAEVVMEYSAKLDSLSFTQMEWTDSGMSFKDFVLTRKPMRNPRRGVYSPLYSQFVKEKAEHPHFTDSQVWEIVYDHIRKNADAYRRARMHNPMRERGHGKDITYRREMIAGAKKEANGPEEGDYIIQPSGKVSQDGKVILANELSIQDHMNATQYWPSVWSLDDHGGLTLLNYDEEEGWSDYKYVARKKLGNPCGSMGNPKEALVAGKREYIGHNAKLTFEPRIGVWTCGPRSKLYGLGDGSVLIECKCDMDPKDWEVARKGYVGSVEYTNALKAKADYPDKHPQTPFLHDFKETQPRAFRVKEGLLLKAQDKPLWGMR